MTGKRWQNKSSQPSKKKAPDAQPELFGPIPSPSNKGDSIIVADMEQKINAIAAILQEKDLPKGILHIEDLDQQVYIEPGKD